MRKKYISKKKVAYLSEKFRISGTPYIGNEYWYMSPKNEKLEFEDECPLYSSGVDNTLQIQRTNTFIIRMWFLSINQMRL